MAGDQDPTEPLRRYFEGMFGEEGAAILDEIATEDVTFESVTGDAYEGREVIKEVLAESMEAYDEFDIEVDWIVAEGDRVVASTRNTAKSREGILGIPPPEDARTIDTIFHARVEDGRIAYLRQVFDTRQMMPVAVRRGRGAALEQMRDGVVVLDERALVVDANPAAIELLESGREAVLGEPIESVLGTDDLAIDDREEPTEIEHDGRTYEVRTSPIFAEAEEPVGHTLVARDVTERKRRTRTLAEQRDELERLSDLNAVLRGVNQVLVSATSRQEIDRAVCERLADTDLYDAACVGDVQTWAGDAERWTVAGDEDPRGLVVPELAREPGARSDGGASVRRAFEPALATSPGEAASGARANDAPEAVEPEGIWTVVPLLYGTTVYGALGLCTSREAVSDRERAVLVELGETIGHAINALETRRLLSAEATVALELSSTDEADPLVAAFDGRGSSGELELEGLVPAGEGQLVAYLRASGADPDAVVEQLSTAADGTVRTVREDEDVDARRVEWTIAGPAPLGALVESGAHVRTTRAIEDGATYEVQVASDADVRALVDRVRRQFPEVRLVSKEERSGPPATPEAIPGPDGTELTQRQREALEAAYRSGYFAWPRDSTAEEVAESLDVAPSTFHSHLRKAEAAVLESFLDDGPGGS